MSKRGGYTVRIKRSAEKELDHLPDSVFRRITLAVLRLESDPRPPGSKKLRGVQDYRLRVGQYRILYSVDDGKRVVAISAIGHRREVYRSI